MQRIIGMVLMLCGISVVALAQDPVPEVSAASASSALALVAGALLVYRGRRR